MMQAAHYKIQIMLTSVATGSKGESAKPDWVAGLEVCLFYTTSVCSAEDSTLREAYLHWRGV